MKWPVLVASIAAAGIAIGRYLLETQERLAEQQGLTAGIQRGLEEDFAILENRGAPPGVRQLQSMRATIQQVAEDLAGAKEEFFAGAACCLDYLEPRDRRPATTDGSRSAQLLGGELLDLRLALQEHPEFYTGALGIDFVSVSSPMSEDREVLLDQGERLLLVRHVLRCLEQSPEVRLERIRLSRPSRGLLVADLELVAGIAGLVTCHERLLAWSADLPPRSLEELELVRLEPEEWSFDIHRLDSPPFRLRLRLSLLCPERMDQWVPDLDPERSPE
jgi:hypothetical protein